MKRVSLILFLLVYILKLFSQNIDTPIIIKIKPVSINRVKNSLSKEDIFELNELENFSFNTLDNIIDNNAKISLKKYGEGQLSTISVKGFNSSQTNIEWNGVKINSPTLGQADISTISVGNNTSLSLSDNNSDNIAGSLSLKNKINFKQKNTLIFSSSLSDFGNFSQAVSYEFSKKNKFYSNTNLSASYNLNKYSYQNKSFPTSEESLLQNAENKLFHLEQINAFKLKKDQQIKLFFKVFYADRNIAPTIYEFSSTKNQKDNLYLAKLGWTKLNKKKYYYLNINSSFVNQQLRFKLSKTSKSILNSSNSIQTNVFFNQQFSSKSYFTIKIKNEIENGNSNNFKNPIWRNKLQVKSSFKTSYKRMFFIDISLAELLVNSKLSQPLTNINIEYKPRTPANIVLHFDYNRKVRYPSLNDLYWNPGGNINLKEEYAHSFNFMFGIERTIKIQKDKKIYFKNKFECFNVFSENYIQWQPTNNGYWAPKNLGNVYSRGFTNNFKIQYFLTSKTILNNILSVNFTRITKTNNLEQLIYVPIHSLNNRTKISTKWFNFSINQQYISEKYTNYSNTLALERFYLLDLSISKKILFNKRHELFVTLEANNILNETYFTYINRALPKRNFFLKLKYVLK